MRNLIFGALTVLTGLACTGCMQPESEGVETVVNLLNTHGEDIGSGTVKQTAAGAEIHLTVTHLNPGMHAIHIHGGNACNPPDFTAAGDHFNPDNKAHGFDAKNGPHAGDLRNFQVAEDGTATVDRTVDSVTLDDGPMSILGRAIVIHEGADDYISQPSGESGSKVACGVIRQGAA